MNYPTNMLQSLTRIVSVLSIAGLFMVSCKKNDTADDNSISNDEIAEAVTQSVSATSGGLVQQTEINAEIATQKHLTCGETRDTSFSGQSALNAAVRYLWSVELSRTLTCNGNVPSQLTLSHKGKFVYTTPRMSSNDSSYAQTIITGLEPVSTILLLNSNYVRKGSQQSLIRLKRSFTSTITITGNNITVSKATRRILSGTANWKFEGKTSGGVIITREGSITFLGNQQAKLQLNNGGEYNLQW